MANEQDQERLTVNEVATVLQTKGDMFLAHQFLLARDTHTQDPREIKVPFSAYTRDGIKVFNASYEKLAKHLLSGDIYNVEASKPGGSFDN